MSHASKDTKGVSTCVDHTHHITGKKQYVSQLVLTKPFPCQLGHKIPLNICWPNPSQASEDTKCISTCVNQTSPTSQHFPQHVCLKIHYQHVLTKRIRCQRAHIMHLKICWPNPINASKDTKRNSTSKPNSYYVSWDTKCISTCGDQKCHMPARIQKVSQLVLTKTLPCLRGFKMYPILARTKHKSKDVLTRTHPMPARTQNIFQQELTKTLSWQRGHKMYPYMCLPNTAHTR